MGQDQCLQWVSGGADQAVPNSWGDGTAVAAGKYTYDAENLLKRAEVRWTPTVTGVTEYGYDGEGRRVVRREGGVVKTVFVYDALGQMVAEYGEGAAMPCTTCYVTVDHLGSTRVVWGADGQMKKLYDYAPFGEEVTANYRAGDTRYPGLVYPRAGGQGVSMEFTGKERDAETGLDYFGARYMSSAQGRFTSADAPFADQFANNPQSWNLYPYVRNNPLRFTDLDGRKCVNGLNEDGDACFEIDVKPKTEPDVKLDSDLFLAVASGVNRAAPVVEGAAMATAVVATAPLQAAATIVVIDGVAYSLEALLALGPEALAQLVATGKVSQAVFQRIAAQSPIVANQIYLRLFAQSNNTNIPQGWLNGNNYIRIGEGFAPGGPVFRIAIGSKHVPLPSWVPGLYKGTLHINLWRR